MLVKGPLEQIGAKWHFTWGAIRWLKTPWFWQQLFWYLLLDYNQQKYAEDAISRGEPQYLTFGTKMLTQDVLSILLHDYDIQRQDAGITFWTLTLGDKCL